MYFLYLNFKLFPNGYYDRARSDYRFRFRYEKQQDNKVLIQYAFGDDPNEQQQMFAMYYYRIEKMPRITRIHEILPNQLGSKQLLRVKSIALTMRKYFSEREINLF